MSLELTGVTVSFGRADTRTTVFDSLDVTFEPGRMTALAGPSGSGKSTLLAVAGALLRPTAGQVLLDGEDLAGLSDAQRAKVRRERIGYMFQSGNLLSGLPAVEQLLAAAYISGERPRTHRSRAQDALTGVGLGHRLRHRPEQLSGGERQRVALARALFLAPKLLLVDEPTAAVDRSQAAELAGLLAERTRQNECVTVVATHDPAVAEAADRVVDMAALTAAASSPALPGR
ncbi:MULTISPECIES: ABC transporter ATP-binding protein [unclassified Streptomyces]|uniref:ABC transporter ATP-binding protein n=1 Tax=unclassified Streptomyces TaxID=2593676 RepID=UPI002257F8B1|nr:MULTISPECIES: ABC transporter ATP-binding protein [unclassified Streptomyces]WSP58397.1 ABC transporter ATP-binding protein [Streptomyces sp. NBC_01241]WSU21028.1 ABC transporter ATP-binding protein [Streptomyces sp. NBC_01108]MCX4790151.1 ABC transporter ATP-binding protein [Streptomyces sp. NBC_01221]MCX4794121.1 ABC transporter ATP-binding protein [Streptomyces sp. NBC_01242]WSJ35521.1 ABC transporter ATP-binding protein [Streptomyces sp. NBC_01321]